MESSHRADRIVHDPARTGTLPRRRAEARARLGHERVAADAMAFEPLADAPPASLSYSHCQTAQFLRSRGILASGFSSFLFSPSSLPTPERGDWRSAQRRPALIRVAQ